MIAGLLFSSLSIHSFTRGRVARSCRKEPRKSRNEKNVEERKALETQINKKVAGGHCDSAANTMSERERGKKIESRYADEDASLCIRL